MLRDGRPSNSLRIDSPPLDASISYIFDQRMAAAIHLPCSSQPDPSLQLHRYLLLRMAAIYQDESPMAVQIIRHLLCLIFQEWPDVLAFTVSAVNFQIWASSKHLHTANRLFLFSTTHAGF
eukprot:Gb_29117 [translate_table: standard]